MEFKNSNQLQNKLVDHRYQIQKVLIIKKRPKHQLERTKPVSKHSQTGQAYKNMSNLMTNQEVHVNPMKCVLTVRLAKMKNERKYLSLASIH